jgi:ribose 5-phosphate isomerase
MQSPVILNDLKKAAAESAVALLKDGMIVGLGSGSTAALAVRAIGRLVAQGLRITGIATSEETAELARGRRLQLRAAPGKPPTASGRFRTSLVGLRRLT